jgi:hypothetical protein
VHSITTDSYYLLSSTGSTTAAGLSRLLEGDLSHDKINRLLSGHDTRSGWRRTLKDRKEYEQPPSCQDSPCRVGSLFSIFNFQFFVFIPRAV